MQNNQFSEEYAKLYDLIYKDKDYISESNYVTSLLKKHRGNTPIKSILDIACGTGGHAIPLAQRGYRLTAQDISVAMVEIGQKKAALSNIQIKWHPGVAMQNFSYDCDFDAVICMFSAIDYIVSDQDLKVTFSNIHKSLRPSGLFIMDFWNANAVRDIYSKKKEKKIHNGKITLTRVSTTHLDIQKDLLEINMRFTTTENGRKLSSGEETHVCRSYYIEKMKAMLAASSFNVLDIHPFMDEGSIINNQTWNITSVCRAQS